MATREELVADRATLVLARNKLLAGEMVSEVARNGRRLVMKTPSLADINTAIADTDVQIAEIDAAAVGARRFRALRPTF